MWYGDQSKVDCMQEAKCFNFSCTIALASKYFFSKLFKHLWKTASYKCHLDLLQFNVYMPSSTEIFRILYKFIIIFSQENCGEWVELILYLFEYKAQNFLPKEEIKVWVPVINEGSGGVAVAAGPMRAQARAKGKKAPRNLA